MELVWSAILAFSVAGAACRDDDETKNNFDPADGGWGAWELALRWAIIASNAPAANLGRDQTHTTEYTVGVNWWMTPNVAMRINWERFIYDDDIAAGRNGSLQRYEDCSYVRWQVDF